MREMAPSGLDTIRSTESVERRRNCFVVAGKEETVAGTGDCCSWINEGESVEPSERAEAATSAPGPGERGG